MEKKNPNKQPKKQTNQKIPNTTQQDFGIFFSWVFPKAVLNLAVRCPKPWLLLLLEQLGCAAAGLLLLRVSARLLLQPNPCTACLGSSSVTEMHSEEEGVRWREEQTLLTLGGP